MFILPNSLDRAARYARFEGILGFSVPSIFLSWGEFNANHNFWTRLPSLAHKNKTENQWQRTSRWWVEFLSREGGTQVTRVYIKESTYSWNIQSVYARKKISICLNKGREESIGNDDVSIFPARK